ncbi:MAG: hypothetical protein IKM10_07275 [Bacteroidaceae bacterium]|nr:hypothetical protein [Bacteroidaceae bacterium]
MKRNLFALFAVAVLVFTVMPTSLEASTASLPQPQQELSELNGWISIGEVEASSGGYITVELQVMKLGSKLVYRVKYQTHYYAVLPYEGHSANAYFDINGKRYLLNVPSW